MRSFRTASRLLATALLTLGAACSDPELASDLQPEGDPHVVEVNVYSEGSVFGLTDPSGFGLLLGEAATFCRQGTEFKVNSNYCPEARDEIGAPIRGEREVAPLMDVVPYSQQFGSATFWHVRIIFDELLDPDIEDPIMDDMGNIVAWTIAETQPVELTCGGVDVAYDGFYDPSGNWLTFPPGPALVVQATEFVATGTADCEVSLKDGAVTDKDGNEVPSDELGPYTFGLAPLTLYGTDPTDSGDPAMPSSGVDPAGSIFLNFAAPVDVTTIASRITFEDSEGNPVPFTVTEIDPLDPEMTPVPEEDRIFIFIVPDAPLDENTVYTVTIASEEGDAITDIAGGELVLFDPATGEPTTTNTITFQTGTAE
jgi:hypothetical protein